MCLSLVIMIFSSWFKDCWPTELNLSLPLDQHPTHPQFMPMILPLMSLCSFQCSDPSSSIGISWVPTGAPIPPSSPRPQSPAAPASGPPMEGSVPTPVLCGTAMKQQFLSQPKPADTARELALHWELKCARFLPPQGLCTCHPTWNASP